MFGVIDATDLSFAMLRDRVFKAITSIYSYSTPTLELTNTGIFPVFVSGEVVKAEYVDAWGLMRLSDLISHALNSASTRNVIVKSADGKTTTYDLYKALLEGDDSQNPYLKVGDTVTFTQKELEVVLAGAVNRAGTYQIKKDETLSSVLSSYSHGLTSQADVKSIHLKHMDGLNVVDSILSYEDAKSVKLSNGDVVLVDSLSIENAAVSIEGALVPAGTNTNYIQGAYNTRYFYQFSPGETMLSMFNAVSNIFSSYSDLKNAVLVRGDEQIALDIEAILFGNSPLRTMTLLSGDRIVIPFSQMLVTVVGGVNEPGNYGYVPGKGLNYYIGLAGGLSTNAKGLNDIRVVDKFGDEVDKTQMIPSEATIEVAVKKYSSNIAPIVTTVGLVSSVVAIVYSVVQIVSITNK